LGFEALMVSLVALAGCEPPDDIVPVTAPGAPLPKKPIPGDEAQALGESASTAPVETVEDKDFKPATPTKIGEKKTTKSGVVYETLREGTGDEIKSGQVAVVHYEGKLEDGKIFDSSRNREPGNFRVGKGGDVIKGWNEAIPGMKVGEKRRLFVPSEAGYGSRTMPKIPANSKLIFEVELVGIR
jgi:FKBP-type peptidyl-prolyl cis-trans isomerase FkpA